LHVSQQLGFVYLCLLGFHVLLFTSLCLFEHARGFFDKSVLLHFLLLGFGNFTFEEFLLSLEVSDVLNLNLEFITKLASLDNC